MQNKSFTFFNQELYKVQRAWPKIYCAKCMLFVVSNDWITNDIIEWNGVKVLVDEKLPKETIYFMNRSDYPK